MTSRSKLFFLCLLVLSVTALAENYSLWNQANLSYGRARYLPSPKREEALDRLISAQCSTPECRRELALMLVYLDFKERLKSLDRKETAQMLDRLSKLQSVVVSACGPSEQCRRAEITSLCRYYSEVTLIVQEFCEANFFVSQTLLSQKKEFRREEGIKP